MNRMRSQMRLAVRPDAARRDSTHPFRITQMLPCNVTLPVRALAKNSSPKEPTSRVITRIAIANHNPNLNAPSFELRHMHRNASKPTFPCSDGPSIGRPTGTKSQETLERQRAQHCTAA